MPGLREPRITLVPQVALLEFRGDSKLGVGASPVRLAQLGLGDRDEDYGGMVRVGDGFSGFDFAVQHIENKSADTGVLTAPWGNLPGGATVRTQVDGLELRLRYIAGIFDWESDEGIRIEAGAGATAGYREYSFKADDFGSNAQRLDIQDEGMPYIASRARVSYLGVGFQADYAINPDLNLGGDIEGLTQDLELTLSYHFEDQDLKVLAGYRRSWVEADGFEGTSPYELDLTVDGYVFGLELTF